MSNFDSDGGPDNEWEERGELAWNEFDWERYLREQDESIHRYLRLYESCRGRTDRIDAVAEKMGWGDDEWSDGDDQSSSATEEDESDDFTETEEVYTLHKNPIFIATKAIALSLQRSWEQLSTGAEQVPQSLAVNLLVSLHRSEDQAVQAIHALDFGDYAMAVSLLKRALSALNSSLALVNSDAAAQHRAVVRWRDEALPQLFDLREIWLRVITECRDELDRPVDEES